MFGADRPGRRCERPERGRGRRQPASLSSEARESLSWQRARGRPQRARQGHLLSPAPASLRGPGGVGRRPSPWTPAGCRGQLASSYLPLEHLPPGKQQPSRTPVSLSSSSRLNNREAPSSPRERAVLPNECGGYTHPGRHVLFRKSMEANTGTNISTRGNVHALGSSCLHRRARV